MRKVRLKEQSNDMNTFFFVFFVPSFVAFVLTI